MSKNGPLRAHPMHQPAPAKDQAGIGRRVSLLIILGVVLAASAVHAGEGGPARFLPGGAHASLSTLAVRARRLSRIIFSWTGGAHAVVADSLARGNTHQLRAISLARGTREWE